MVSRWPISGQVPVWSAQCAGGADGAPLALGMILSAVHSYDDGRLLDRFALSPLAMSAEPVLAAAEVTSRAGVLLTSNYFWTLPANLDLARAVKEQQPGSLTVFGGPSAPKYEEEAERFLRAHPQVDVIARGEGELTACEMLAALDASDGDVEALSAVAGLTYRVGDRVVRTDDRPRMADLNAIPSPYLTGVFDHLDHIGGIWSIESNRGCPYGCTFCDWGAATMSRVRLFDLNRVKAEMNWLARHGIHWVMMADANFGMFERDLEIAQHVAALHQEYGAPSWFLASLAKNTTKYTVPIIDLLVKCGLMSDANIAFQTTDTSTLVNVRRKNIKLSTYQELADEMRKNGLPISADIMIGLPGSTLESFKTDLQHCIEGETTARVLSTFLLPNSPMSAPDYRAEFGLEGDELGQLVASYSYTREDRAEMIRFHDVFKIAEDFGVLRHVMRYVASVLDRREIDVLWDIYRMSRASPDRYPLTAFFLLAARRYLTVPLSWSLFFAEIEDLCRFQIGMAADGGLATVLRVQEALLPEPSRSYPAHLDLDHDYVRFYRDVIRPEGRDSKYALLTDYGPGSIAIDDPKDLSSRGVPIPGQPLWNSDGDRYSHDLGTWDDGTNWELDSVLARSLRGVAHVR